MTYADSFSDTIIHLLQGGGIGVIRTDTLYGLVARADNQGAVERVYTLKQRTPSKSPIVLVDSTAQLWDTYDKTVMTQLGELWPGKNSVILPSQAAPAWLIRGNESVAYRIPDNTALRQLLAQTGPLIAPSANPEGLPPAMTIDEAKDYFGDAVDFYVEGGAMADATPSRLYRLTRGGLERLR